MSKKSVVKKVGTPSKRRASRTISQADRQTMLRADDCGTYTDIRIAVESDREREKQARRNKVLDFFLKEVRPEMEVDRAYSSAELLDMYTDKNGPNTGMFYHLMLNQADFLNIEHIMAMPTHIQIDEVPENAVTGYTEKINKLIQRGKDFMKDSGLKVILPEPVDGERIEALYNMAENLYLSNRYVQLSKLTVNDDKIKPSDLVTMQRMGIEFKQLRTVSAFWIDRQF